MHSTPPKPQPLAPVSVDITYPAANAHVPFLFTATALIPLNGNNPQGWLTNSSQATYYSATPIFNPGTMQWEFPFRVTDTAFLDQEVQLTVEATDGGDVGSNSIPITVDSSSS